MLHLAVVKGHNYFLEKLLNFIEDGEQMEKKNSYGRTALHIAAINDNKYAAELLVRKRKRLLAIKDNAEYIPLLSAYYNMKLSTYVYLLEVSETEQLHLPLSRYPDDRVQIAVNFLINAIFTKQYDLASSLINIYPELVRRDDQVLMAIAMSFPPKLSFWEAFIFPTWKHVCENIVERSYLLFGSYNFLYKRDEDIIWSMRSFKSTWYSWLLTDIVLILLGPIAALYPIYRLVRLLISVLRLPFSALYFHMWNILATIAFPFKHIDKKKKTYHQAKKMLKFICDEIDASCSNDTNHPYYSGPIFEAVRQDAYKVVQKILRRSYNIIDFKNQQGHNIIQLAIINRSEKVYNLFYPIIMRTESYSTMTDSSMNNLVHLAGRLAPSYVLSRTTGAALQLQREEAETLMLPTHLLKENIYMESPEMVFTREHANLVKEGELWMKTTAESCSITAALIVTIVFAAAITVPGGSNQETGIPLFRKEIAFTIFAVADAISLFSAATSLLVFLSILTTRFSEKDFLVSLPRRLILGLCVLFISATAMMVAFCATLYLVFCDQRPWMLAPIGGLACLPIAVIATLQFPLVVDLFISTYFPIFHKKKFDFVESEISLRMDEE